MKRKFKVQKIKTRKFLTYIPVKINNEANINDNVNVEKGNNYIQSEKVNKDLEESMKVRREKLNDEESPDDKKIKIMELLNKKRKRLKDNVEKEIAEKINLLEKEKENKLKEVDKEIEKEKNNYFSLIDENEELEKILGKYKYGK